MAFQMIVIGLVCGVVGAVFGFIISAVIFEGNEDR